MLRDAGAPITPGPGCEAIEGGVRCAANSVIASRVLRDDDGPTPGHDTCIGLPQQFDTGVMGATLRYDSRQDGVRVDLRSLAGSEDRITGVSTVFGDAGDDVLMGDDRPHQLYVAGASVHGQK